MRRKGIQRSLSLHRFRIHNNGNDMKTYDDVIEWLESTGQDVFDQGVYHYDEGREFSYTESEAQEYFTAAEILEDLRNSLFGEQWNITRMKS